MRLNLGCGRDYREGWVNVDRNSGYKIDKEADFERPPWPFDDSSADEILISEVLEHLEDVVESMRELHRICRPGGKITVKVPYYKWRGAFWDPTHKHFFVEETFDYFRPESTFHIPGYPKFKVVRISFIGGKIRFWEKRHMVVELSPIK